MSWSFLLKPVSTLWRRFKLQHANPAIYLGLIDMVGTVEKGKKADLVLLEASPLENISNTKRISAVIVGGRLIQKSYLIKC
ncbi:MAG: amidohydrolase family protein [Pyrinomonadaceae bacterium]